MSNNQTGAIQLIVVIFLLVGIGITIYLTQFTQVFKPKAAEDATLPKITSWEQRDQLSPRLNEFVYRGTAQSEMGAQYAAPGTPENSKPMSSIIRYRDKTESIRNYDLYLTPALAIWKIVRYESSGLTSQYVGNFPSETCKPDGVLTMTDGVIQPAIGLDGNHGIEAGTPNMMIKTNYGCQSSNYSVPYPVDNYQSAGSGRGDLPEIISPPSWNPTYQTLSSTSVSVPWVYYKGILDKNSPQFKADFDSRYSNPDQIVQSVSDSLNNVSLNNQITILPDGTIQMTHMWNALKKRPWMEHTTYSYWIPFDSVQGGKVIYFDKQTNQYINPFQSSPDPVAFTTYGEKKIQDTDGWFGYFIDKQRPDFGIAFYTGFDFGLGAISVTPPYHPANPLGVPGIVTTHLFPQGYWDKIFYQTFLVIGTKEEMHQKAALLNKYVYNFSVPASSSPSPARKVGDIDNNGKVDIFDFNIFVGDFPIKNLRSDVNQDGRVDIYDFNLLIANFSK